MTAQHSHLGLAAKALLLDTARERFWTFPTIANARELLRIALAHSDGGIIEADDFFMIIETIAYRKKEEEKITTNLRKALDN